MRCKSYNSATCFSIVTHYYILLLACNILCMTFCIFVLQNNLYIFIKYWGTDNTSGGGKLKGSVRCRDGDNGEALPARTGCLRRTSRFSNIRCATEDCLFLMLMALLAQVKHVSRLYLNTSCASPEMSSPLGLSLSFAA